MKTLTLLILGISLLACNKKSSPESLLTNFVDANFAGKLDREDLLEMTSGDFKKQIEESSDEQLAFFLDLDNKKLKKLKILHKSCSEKKCFLTYVISYETMDDNKTTFQTDTKKIAEIIQDADVWKINNIEHLKTFHDSTQEINP